jgi:serine/threonine protein kinase
LLCYTMELCDSGDLREKIVEKQQLEMKFTPSELLSMTYQISRAVRELHELGIMH